MRRGLLVMLAACASPATAPKAPELATHPTPEPATATPEPAAPEGAPDIRAGGLVATVGAPDADPHVRVVRDPMPVHGMAHRGSIRTLSLSLEARAAITVDDRASVRFWPALDGSLEPQYVAVESPVASHAAAHAGSGGSTLAFLDQKRRVVVVTVDDLGQTLARETIAGTRGTRDVAVLAGGDHIASARRDGTIVVHGRDGRERARLRLRGVKPHALYATTDPTLLIALERDGTDDRNSLVFTTHRVRLSDKSGDVSLARESEPVSWDAPYLMADPAIAPDGEHAATTTVAPGNANAIALSVRSLRDPAAGEIFHRDLPYASYEIVGFTAPDQVLAGTIRGDAWVFDLDGGGGATRERALAAWAISPYPSPLATAAGVGSGRRVIAHRQMMFVEELAGDRFFLGYDAFSPGSASFSPDGSAVAWSNRGGDALIVDLDGGETLQLVASQPVERPTLFVAMIADDRVLLVNGAYRLLVVDTVTGATLADEQLAWGASQFAVTPARDVFAYTAGGQLVVVELGGDGALGDAHLINDGHTWFGLLDAGGYEDPLIWTLNPQRTRWRTYSMADLRAGVTWSDLPEREIKVAAESTNSLWFVARDGELFGRTRRGFERWSDLSGARREWLPDGLDVSAASRVTVAPDGEHLLGLGWYDGAMYSLSSGKRRWKRNPDGAAVDWSPDSSALALSFGAAGVVVDVATGKTITERCGGAFRRWDRPPPDLSTYQIMGVCGEDPPTYEPTSSEDLMNPFGSLRVRPSRPPTKRF